jgi:hypothetical protein
VSRRIDAYKTLEAAWNAGVRYYDVSPWYGPEGRYNVLPTGICGLPSTGCPSSAWLLLLLCITTSGIIGVLKKRVRPPERPATIRRNCKRAPVQRGWVRQAVGAEMRKAPQSGECRLQSYRKAMFVRASAGT